MTTQQKWKVGDRVRNLPEHAWVREKSWQDKMSLNRRGVVIEVPMATQDSGCGTLLVEWESLTASKNNPENWRMWIHSNFVERVMPSEVMEAGR